MVIRFFHPRHNSQWPPTLKDFYTRSYPLHYFLILILEKEPVFPFSILSAKQGNYWYHCYNVFGMTWSLTGDLTRDLPQSKPALYHQAIEEAVGESTMQGSTRKLPVKFHWIWPCSFRGDGLFKQLLTDGRTDGRTDDGHRPITKAHHEHFMLWWARSKGVKIALFHVFRVLTLITLNIIEKNMCNVRHTVN